MSSRRTYEAAIRQGAHSPTGARSSGCKTADVHRYIKRTNRGLAGTAYPGRSKKQFLKNCFFHPLFDLYNFNNRFYTSIDAKLSTVQTDVVTLYGRPLFICVIVILTSPSSVLYSCKLAIILFIISDVIKFSVLLLIS